MDRDELIDAVAEIAANLGGVDSVEVASDAVNEMRDAVKALNKLIKAWAGKGFDDDDM